VGKVRVSSKANIAQKVKLANLCKETWGRLQTEERIRYVRRLYEVLKKEERLISETITQEIGTPLQECRGEVNWNWSYIDWFLENVESAISPEITLEDKQSLHRVFYEPIGSAAVITPWNLPFDMFVWGVFPNLLVGNTVVYKTSEECAVTGKLLEKISQKANLPDGVLSFVHGSALEGKFLTEQNIDLVWFTGSSEVGRKIYELCGKKFIKAVLEMGGSNPAIVFPDADIDLAVSSSLSKRFMFCGQTCDADKRLIVHESVYAKFMAEFVRKVKSLIVGDPQKLDVQIGPLVSRKQLNLLESQLKDAVNKGAEIVCGGERPVGLKGSYFLPTVVSKVSMNMRVLKEEVFGPLIPVIAFKDEDEAVNYANNTEYGLGSQVFTKDLSLAFRVAKKIKAGNVDINGAGHFYPFNPFGGYKNSGTGREHGIHGFRELCQIKTVSMKK